MSEILIFKYYCLVCKKEIPIEKIEINRCCPHCKCTDFNLKIFGEN